MKPIVPIHEPKRKTITRGAPADLMAAVLAALVGLTAFAYSLYYFTRFLENDTHPWGIFSAFLLCFGVGAFGYIPAGIIARLAYRAYKYGANKAKLIWALILLLPWLCLSVILVFVSALPALYSLPMLITAVLLALWAIISLLRLKRP